MKKNIILILLLTSLVFLNSCSSNNNLDEDNSMLNNSENQTNTSEESVTTDESTNSVEEIIEDEVEPENTIIEAGSKIPNFEMTTLDGESITLSEYEGKIVLLNFWATWCGYCDREMPDLAIVDKASDVAVIAINSKEKKSLVKEYISDGGYDFLTILDEKGVYTDKFYVNSWPTTFFIDEDGILIGQVLGMLTLDEMETIIDDIRNDKY